jgi:precorrin-2 dehydrogenase/sirohydrochlorin ferrochelatase
MNDLASACFPAWFKLTGVPVLIVGGGKIALRRSKKLVECGAVLTLVSPSFIPGFSELRKKGTLLLVTRPFEPRDLQGQKMVFAATDDAAVNEDVCREAAARGLWVSSGILSEQATLFPGASLNRGGLSIAVSTGGRAPLFAATLRDLLGELLTVEWAEFLETMAEERNRVLQQEGTDSADWEPLRQQIKERFREAIQTFPPAEKDS